MRLRIPLVGLTILLCGGTVFAQFTGDVLGVHNLGPTGKSPISGPSPNACSYCHAPHSGLNMGLWNQTLTTTIYTPYAASGTEQNAGKQPTLGYSTNHCLSCHDGTVGLIGKTVAYGALSMSGSMRTSDVLGSNGNMQSSHPFSLVTPLKDSPDLAASIVASHKTADPNGAVKLIAGNVECISCHDPHVQAKDLVSQNFLVKDSSNGQLCLACHDPARPATLPQVNPLADWSTSVHALNTGNVSSAAQLGSYKTVAANACISCHAPHNAPVGSARILRGQYEQDCLVCHQTGSNVSGMNLYSIVGPEYAAPKYGHEFPGSVSQHDAAEPTLLNNNRHATCVDCHSPHGSESGALTPPPLIRVSQKDIAGIASDGITQLTPAINQYENCLRCHGPSTQKQTLTQFGYLPTRAIADGDFLNVIKQLATGTASSHPVMHIRSSNLLQPSLLAFMTKTDGSPSDRSMGNQILCTDCHNSDDNREFGGSGPNGPHGSIFPHILERNYVFSMASSPGGTITNLTPPNLSATGPYALCAKCHNLSVVQSSTSWSGHINHMNDGFSCSTCHTAHGIIPTSGPISGLRLVNFDVRVAAQNGSLPISYSQGPNTCVLVCHNEAHNQDGTVSPANSRLRVVKK